VYDKHKGELIGSANLGDKWSPRCLWESSQWWSRASISGKLCAGLYGVGAVHKAL